MTDLRCSDCQTIGCECPMGYYAGTVTCDVCGYEFILSAASCAPRVTCPTCDGACTYETD